MKSPDFIIIGAQKCGTTSLVNNLSKHPMIYMSEFSLGSGSEVHFFNRDSQYSKGINWYKNLFKEGYVCGEKTPEYMFEKKAIFRMKKDLPDVKLIMCLRNPVDRFISQFNMRSIIGADKEFISKLKFPYRKFTFDQAIKMSEYIGRGMYYRQISNILQYFDRSQLHIVIMDDINKKRKNLVNPDGVSFSGFKINDETLKTEEDMSKIFDFLGVEDKKLEYDFLFVNKYRIELTDVQIKTLENIYIRENEKLFDFLGYRIKSWEYSK